MSVSNYQELAGKKFNMLTVIKLYKINNNRAKWLCQCDCGNLHIVQANHLKNDHTKSCGCYRKSFRKKHGYSGTPEYLAWFCMIQRCTIQEHPSYHNYGGRGISVCERWFRFENFLNDMGKRPDNLSLDRINNEGNYELDNCRWATIHQQNNNRRSCKNYNEDGTAK